MRHAYGDTKLGDIDVSSLVRALRQQKEELLKLSCENPHRALEIDAAGLVVAALEDALQAIIGKVF